MFYGVCGSRFGTWLLDNMLLGRVRQEEAWRRDRKERVVE